MSASLLTRPTLRRPYPGHALPVGLTGRNRWDSRLGTYNLRGRSLKKLQALIHSTITSAGKCHILVVGPSIEAGETLDPATSAYPTVMRNLLTSARFAAFAGGDGWVLPGNTNNPVDSRMALGTWLADTQVEALGTGTGSRAWAKGNGVGTAMTFTPKSIGNRIKVAYDDAGGPFSMTFGGIRAGAAFVTVPAGSAYDETTGTVTPGGTNAVKVITVDGLLLGSGYACVFTQTTSAVARIAAIAHTAVAGSPLAAYGLMVSNLAIPGFDAYDAQNIASYDTMWNVVTALHAATPFDAVLIGANSMLNDAIPPMNRSAAASQAYQLTAVQRAQAIADTFMVGLVPFANAWIAPIADHLQRRQAAINISDLTGVPILIDPTDRWAFGVDDNVDPATISNLASAAAAAAGLNRDPNPHLQINGNIDLAYALAAILAPGGGSGFFTPGDVGALGINNNFSEITNKSAARAGLGLGTISTHGASEYQLADADLTTIAGFDASVVGAIASDGAGWVKKTVAQFRTWLGLATVAISGAYTDLSATPTLGTAASANKVAAGAVGVLDATDVTLTKWARGIATNNVPPQAKVGTWVYASSASAFGGISLANSSSAQNDSVTFAADLTKGTYNIAVNGVAFSSGAIATIDTSIDGGTTWVNVGTLDLYAVSAAQKRGEFDGYTGITVSGEALIRFKAATRNASNTVGWSLQIARVDFLRTGA